MMTFTLKSKKRCAVSCSVDHPEYQQHRSCKSDSCMTLKTKTLHAMDAASIGLDHGLHAPGRMIFNSKKTKTFMSKKLHSLAMSCSLLRPRCRQRYTCSVWQMFPDHTKHRPLKHAMSPMSRLRPTSANLSCPETTYNLSIELVGTCLMSMKLHAKQHFSSGSLGPDTKCF